ncbi:MAG: hypothetical protein CVU84_10335 [Firmicutes bacterium HGW-Firmicutes-1]|nr:MAG: hypothetical protein CVU84_10335 [Firmicutes bacterium HGW-Firmicutes-1]
MNLGNVGSFYMVFLILLLIVGLGMLAMGLITYMFKPINKKSLKNEGGNFMQNNNWLKLALFSFIGIMISVIILGFLSPNGFTGSSTSGHGDILSQQMGNMNNASGGMMNGNATIMNSSGNMSGMGTIGYSQADNNVMMNNFYQMQLQINQIQLQITQLQQMMNSTGSMQMQSSPASNSSGMSGMGMMNMGGMSGGGTGSTMTTTMPASAPAPDPAPAGGGMSMPMM